MHRRKLVIFVKLGNVSPQRAQRALTSYSNARTLSRVAASGTRTVTWSAKRSRSLFGRSCYREQAASASAQSSYTLPNTTKEIRRTGCDAAERAWRELSRERSDCQ
jgi:hypothetical protein